MNSTSTVQSLSEEEVARLTPGPDSPETPDATQGDADADETEPIPKDELFHLLQNSRRRAVLRYLRGREGPVQMRDVAEQVAAWEHDTTVEQLTSNERQRVYIALYQSHLETLAEAGVIDYNKPRGVIEPQPLLDYTVSYIDAGEAVTSDEEAAEGRDGDPWAQRYLGVSVVGALLLVGSAVDFSVFQAVSSFATSVLILLMFSVLTLAKLAIDDTDGTGED